MRLANLLILVIFFSEASFAQQNTFDIQKYGKWTTQDEGSIQFNDKAQWIWLHDSLESDLILARKSFELEALPKYTNLLITASSQYQLYVNGIFVNRGPARSAPHHQSFDIIDISTLLHLGENVLAVRVHHQQNKFSYHLKGRAGLLAQLDFPNGSLTPSIVTDGSWLVKDDPSWSSDAPVINRFQMVVTDRVDMRSHISDWNQLECKEEDWVAATSLMRKVGWPAPQKDARPQAMTPPWTALVPRDLPYLNQHTSSAIDVILSKELTDWQQPILLDGTVSSDVDGWSKAFANEGSFIEINNIDSSNYKVIIFDLGRVHNAIPILDIIGPRGTKIDVIAAPFLVDGTFSHKVVFSDFHDQLTLSGQRDVWEATYFKPTRYLGIAIPPHTKNIQLHNAAFRQLEYPFSQVGSMHSDEAPWVQQYMDASVRTIDACTTDAYTDNYRERRQYAQTGYYAGLGNYWTYGDTYLQRRYLMQIAQEQEANGMMPAYAPLGKDDFMIILDSNCLYIRSLKSYLLHSGDFETVEKLLPAAQKLMDLLHSYTNDLGLIDNPPYPYWLDHAVIDRRGANLTLNGHYLGAIEDFGQVLSWFNQSDTVFKVRANRMRESIRQNFWNDAKGLFVDALIDGKQSSRYSEHANAMALSLNIATQEQAHRVANAILDIDNHDFVMRKNGMTVVTPAMSYFLHKGLCEYGFIDQSLAMFRKRFDKMLDPKGNMTLYEEWWLDGTGRSGRLKPTSRSDAQTESAFPPALFAQYLLGVKPTSPGLSTVDVSKSPTSLSHMSGIVPSPNGALSIEWHIKNENDRSLSLNIPSGMVVHLDTNSLETSASNLIINKERAITDKSIDQKNLHDSISLTSGIYKISF